MRSMRSLIIQVPLTVDTASFPPPVFGKTMAHAKRHAAAHCLICVAIDELSRLYLLGVSAVMIPVCYLVVLAVIFPEMGPTPEPQQGALDRHPFDP